MFTSRVLHSTGRAGIGSSTYEVAPGDIFSIRSTWAQQPISATEETDLFSTSDVPVLEAIGLHPTERTEREWT